MAVIYYPKNQLLYVRDTTSSASNYESVVLAVSPNTVLYFDTSSAVTAESAMNLAVTASWALTASISQVLNVVSSASWASSSVSSSYVPTSNYNPYSTIITSSTYWKIIEGYLMWKYGLQAKLPPSHPFASSPPTSSRSL
jgi:hypothetical protein